MKSRRPRYSERSARRPLGMRTGFARAVAERVRSQLEAHGFDPRNLHTRSAATGGVSTITFTLRVGAANLTAEVDAPNIEGGFGLTPADSVDAWRLCVSVVAQLLAAAVDTEASFISSDPGSSEAA